VTYFLLAGADVMGLPLTAGTAILLLHRASPAATSWPHESRGWPVLMAPLARPPGTGAPASGKQ